MTNHETDMSVVTNTIHHCLGDCLGVGTNRCKAVFEQDIFGETGPQTLEAISIAPSNKNSGISALNTVSSHLKPSPWQFEPHPIGGWHDLLGPFPLPRPKCNKKETKTRGNPPKDQRIFRITTKDT